MTIRYDESMTALLDICKVHETDLSHAIVLRDAVGRLGIVFAKRFRSNNLSQALRTALGAYALAEPVLPSSMFEGIEAAGPRKLIIMRADGEFQDIRLLDRRIVGADWLSDLAQPETDPPRFIFGSLKGGVGRTTALAVFAADLAQHGLRVLCVDLDLEAPGLSSMLLKSDPDDDRRPKFGGIDYLVENSIGGVADDELFDFIGLSHLAGGLIHVVPAVGRITDEHPENMIGKLSRALVEDVSSTGRMSVAQQMRAMVDRFCSYGDYDVVLIDARAGLAESTAGAWLALGAQKLFLFGTDQQQTFSGYRYILAHLLSSLGIPSFDDEQDWRTRLSFVQSKAPNSPSALSRFRDRLHELCSEMLYEVEEGPETDWVFNFPSDAVGTNVPHDATHIYYDTLYDAFDPLVNQNVLTRDIYLGPFGPFLSKAWSMLGRERG